jgi:uncharacterized protein (TIGR03083 family)
MLDAITERSDVLRAAAAAADPGAAVPGCPEWTVRDLVVHVGQVQRSWAAKVGAGTEGAPAVDDVPEGDLLEWSEQSTETLTAALRDAGPDAQCWTWWQESDAPSTSGAVARHQVQEAALHAYDAQSACGTSEEVPSAIAIDCVDEFLVVSLGAMGAWPHPAARVDVVAAEGPRWAVHLDTVAKVSKETGTADATVSGPASDLILAIYSRIPLEALTVDGDRDVVRRLVDWAATSTE